jgi:hypothetical protein
MPTLRVTRVTKSDPTSSYGMIESGLRGITEVLTEISLGDDVGDYACLYFLGTEGDRFKVGQRYTVTLTEAPEVAIP